MKLQLHSLALVLSLFFQASAGQDLRTLEAGKPIEREIAGGESHTYQISLAAEQFVRFRLEQRAIDATLTLSGPDGKQLAVMNLTRAGAHESLSLEAQAAGSYQLAVRGNGAAALRGSYRLEAAVQAQAGAEDRKRLTAEGLLVEVNELRKQASKTAPQVIEKTQQALSVWRELEETSWIVYSLYLIGNAYYDLSQFDKAIEYLEQSLGVARQLKDRAGEGTALNNLGSVYFAQSRYDQAIEYYEQALGVARELKDKESEARGLNNLGNVNFGLGRYGRTVEYYEQALAIQHEVKNRSGEASALNGLGVVYRNLGRTEKAIEYNEQALVIVRELKDRRVEGGVLNNLGVAYRSLGRNEKAIEYYEQSLGIAREIKDRASEARVLNSLGNSYSGLSRNEKAIEYFEQALAINREVKERAGEGVALNNLGNSYSGLGRYENAIEYYAQALVIAREVKNRSGEASALNNLGFAYRNLGRTEKAIEYNEQALGIAREVKNRIDEGNALYESGIAYHALGRLDEAIRHHEQALFITREIKAQPREAETLYYLAQGERKRGNLVRARTLVEESLAIAESLRTGVVSPESRTAFFAKAQVSYQLYADLLMRLHQAESTKGLDALAVETSERQRARSLLNQLTEARVDIREGVDVALLERERLLGRQLNAKALQLTQTNKPELVVTLKHEISQLETDYERAQAAIRKASPHYAALTQPQPLKFKEIQAQLDAHTLLLEYALGEERSYLWAITKDSLKSYELPKAEMIDKNARQLHELLSSRSNTKRGESVLQRQQRIAQAEAKLPAAAQELSQSILAPVAAQLGNKRLVIVADGALQYIPFAMLPDPVVARSQPLIVNHEIVSLPSASALAIQRAELAGRKPAPKMLAVIADPVFDRTDARFKSLAPETSDKQIIASDDTRSIEHLADKSDNKLGDKSDLTTRRLVIPRLPFTRQEATRLLALTPKDSSFGLIDFQASRETVLKGALAQYRYVHFATHGLLDSERPGLSSLVLSMVDEQGKQQNGFLRANDIYNLKLPAELVVLSACQTGLGKEIKGEGLVGLTRGFMYAGAARVVVSLWSVNDRATAELMTKFYEKMLKQGERPAAALRAAQVEMWKQKQWQSPYYWAAFTLQGEWR